jgi:hypothetical protein
MKHTDLDLVTREKLFSLCNYFNVNPNVLISYLQSLDNIQSLSIEDIKKDLCKFKIEN